MGFGSNVTANTEGENTDTLYCMKSCSEQMFLWQRSEFWWHEVRVFTPWQNSLTSGCPQSGDTFLLKMMAGAAVTRTEKSVRTGVRMARRSWCLRMLRRKEKEAAEVLQSAHSSIKLHSVMSALFVCFLVRLAWTELSWFQNDPNNYEASFTKALEIYLSFFVEALEKIVSV